MRLFFSKHELKLRRKRTIAAIICVVLVLGVYWILTRPQKAAPEMPTVIVEPVVKDDVEIYGEYVGTAGFYPFLAAQYYHNIGR